MWGNKYKELGLAKRKTRVLQVSYMAAETIRVYQELWFDLQLKVLHCLCPHIQELIISL